MSKVLDLAKDLASFEDNYNFTDGTYSGNFATQTMFRNKIINGNFDIWQRGTSQTSSGYGSVDRWSLSRFGTTTRTGTQQAFTLGQIDVPGNPKYYLSNAVTTSGNATDYANINTRIEGVSTLSGKTATLSFWAKSDANRNIASELFQRFGTGGTPSAGVSEIGVTTHSLTTSWQKFTVTTSIPSISGKILGTDNNNYLGLVLWFDAGSNYDSRTNSLGNQSGNFDIAQVQLEEGSVATPFEHRPIGMELSLCQRYFQTHYTLGAGVQNNSTTAMAYCSLPVTMRKLPTINTRSGGWTNINVEHDDTYDVTAVYNTHGITTGERIEECSSFTVNVTTSGTNTVGYGVCIMCDRNGDAFTFDAEL